ncbi:MAG: M48 family metallopeptidase [Pirellulales bacterium]
MISTETQTSAQRDEAKRYGRVTLRLSLADMAIDLVYLTLAAFWLGPRVDRWLSDFAPLSGDQSLLRVAALVAALFAIHALISFPLSVYSGHVVEHRFQLSQQTFGRWSRKYLLRMTLSLAFSAALFTGLYAIIWWVGAYWWLAAAGAFFVVSVILGQLAPVVFLPLFYKIERLEDPSLAERMQALAAGTGLTVEGVYRMKLSEETSKANAMLAGLGRTRRVLMGDTLLDSFTPEEIDVIFAHEIGHHVHRHIPKMIATGVAVSLLGFWLCDQFIRWWTGIADPATWPVATQPLLVWFTTLYMMALGPLTNAVSRRYERQCDRYALRRTNDVAAYRTAFTKLARLNKADMEPNPVEVLLFHSHPPIGKRLALADEV